MSTMSTMSTMHAPRPVDYPKFTVVVSDGNEIEEYVVQGAPKYRESDWLEFTQRRGEQTHVVAAFPSSKVLSMVEMPGQ